MEFHSDNRFREKRQSVRLQLYAQPPINVMQLEEFEKLAVDRIAILKALELVAQDYVKHSPDYVTNVCKKLTKLKSPLAHSMLLLSTEQDDISGDLQRDHLSHFITLLAYCSNEDLRHWFLAQEMELFRFRFHRENSNTITTFLRLNDLRFEPAADHVRQRHLTDMKAACPRKLLSDVFYAVPFTAVLDLVRWRKVFLLLGQAFVNEDDVISLIISAFRATVSHNLSVMHRMLPNLGEENRLMPVINVIKKFHMGSGIDTLQFKGNHQDRETVSACQIDNLSKVSFPPCMQKLHQSLIHDSHLRHWGRLQYGLFLKGVGVPLNEGLQFFRAAFSKKTDMDKFEKQYAYNIRHSYGKEGKRVDYAPHSCMKIILSNPPGPGDAHGCPFRHTDSKLLRQKLELMKWSPSQVESVMAKVHDKQYQLACREYFKAKHNLDTTDVAICHPNQYYEESRRLFSGKNEIVSGSQDRLPNKFSEVRKVPVKLENGKRDDSEEMDEIEFMMMSQET